MPSSTPSKRPPKKNSRSKNSPSKKTRQKKQVGSASSEPLPPVIRGDLSDESLIIQYRETGDREIFQTLITRFKREIFVYLHRYLGNLELAEDAFQATFLQVHLKAQQFDPSRRFRPWLYAVATNQAIDLQRRSKRHRIASLDHVCSSENDDRGGQWSDKLVGNSPDPLDVASKMENRRWVHDAVDSLGDPLKQVVHLVYYQGMKYREAAETLGVPVGTVKSRLHAAVSRLGLRWDESHSTEPEASQEA